MTVTRRYLQFLRVVRAAALTCMLVAVTTPSPADTDLSGIWSNFPLQEDGFERLEGPYLGDFTGFPLNDAGRQRADSYSDALLTVREHQCMPHPSEYSLRSPTSVTIIRSIDPVTGRLIAFRIEGLYLNADRTIWMDGRPHPGPEAIHSWAGFSTGTWQGYVLKVETTHIKTGWLNRNGVPASERATMTEFFFRHGDHLTILQIVKDPIYLSEPYVRSTDLALNEHPGSQGQDFYRCFPTDEVLRSSNDIPNYLLGKNPFLHEFANRFHLPFQATRGIAAAMYPEYVVKLQQMLSHAHWPQ